MFPTRYFPDRYFAPRYWPKVGADSTDEPHVVEAFASYAPIVEAFAEYDPEVDAFASEG